MSMTRGQKKNMRRERDGRRSVENRIKSNMLSLVPSYKGQVVAALNIVSLPTLMTMPGSAPYTIASVVSVDPTTVVDDWATRFASLWEEYRIVKVVADVTTFSSTLSGQLACYWDEQSSSAPTANSAERRGIFKFPLSANNRKHIFRWNPTDYLDLEYKPVGTASTPVWFKLFSDSANYGTSAADQGKPVGTIVLTLNVQFRGFQGS